MRYKKPRRKRSLNSELKDYYALGRAIQNMGHGPRAFNRAQDLIAKLASERFKKVLDREVNQE